MMQLLTITHDFEGVKYKVKERFSIEDKKYIEKVLYDNFKDDCSYNRKENCIYVCNNQHLDHPAFLDILSKYRVFVFPSLFPEDFKKKK